MKKRLFINNNNIDEWITILTIEFRVFHIVVMKIFSTKKYSMKNVVNNRTSKNYAQTMIRFEKFVELSTFNSTLLSFNTYNVWTTNNRRLRVLNKSRIFYAWNLKNQLKIENELNKYRFIETAFQRFVFEKTIFTCFRNVFKNIATNENEIRIVFVDVETTMTNHFNRSIDDLIISTNA